MQNDCLRIEFDCCCESLDLLENDEERDRVVTWILMMNRLGATAPTEIASNCHDASLTVEIPYGEAEADEKNARHAVADLLALFDPAEHRVVRVLCADGQKTDVAPMVLWPGKNALYRSHRHASAIDRLEFVEIPAVRFLHEHREPLPPF